MEGRSISAPVYGFRDMETVLLGALLLFYLCIHDSFASTAYFVPRPTCQDIVLFIAILFMSPPPCFHIVPLLYCTYIRSRPHATTRRLTTYCISNETASGPSSKWLSSVVPSAGLLTIKIYKYPLIGSVMFSPFLLLVVLTRRSSCGS